jgi:two-component system, OmpR family, response regulator RegX3
MTGEKSSGGSLPTNDRPGVPDGRITILVVEDEVSYQEALLTGLSREGYHVQLASDGLEALDHFVNHRPDLVVLDLLLPTMPGIEVCRRMRALAPVPIIIVSALDSESDIVRGLEIGAEDYIAKPFRLRELVARIRSVLRRTSSPPLASLPSSSVGPSGAESISAGPFDVNFARRVVSRDGRAIHLSRREFDLLGVLVSPPGQVRTREELIDKLWSDRDLSDTRTLDTHVRRLRIKLEPDPGQPRYLVTVRGVGFRFEP